MGSDSNTKVSYRQSRLTSYRKQGAVFLSWQKWVAAALCA